jgi:hypothetical protein
MQLTPVEQMATLAEYVSMNCATVITDVLTVFSQARTIMFVLDVSNRGRARRLRTVNTWKVGLATVLVKCAPVVSSVMFMIAPVGDP